MRIERVQHGSGPEAGDAAGEAPAQPEAAEPFTGLAALDAVLEKGQDPVEGALQKIFPGKNVYLDSDSPTWHIVTPDEDPGVRHLSFERGRVVLTLAGDDFWTHLGSASASIAPPAGTDAASLRAFQTALSATVKKLEARVARGDFDQPVGAARTRGTSGAAAATAAPASSARARVVDLGLLEPPGAELRNKIQTLKPGEKLRFTTRENQIQGMGAFDVSPAGALVVKRKVTERPPPGLLGGKSTIRYEISLPAGTPPGTKVKLTTSPHFQVRHDRGWAFSFQVKAG